MTNDKDWKWDGVIINGFAKFNRLIRQDCQRERVTGALDERSGQPEPAEPTEQIFAGNPYCTPQRPSTMNSLNAARTNSSKSSQ